LNLFPLAPQVGQNVGSNGLSFVGHSLRVSDSLRASVEGLLARQKLLSLVESNVAVAGRRSVSKELISSASLLHVGKLLLSRLD
jgi:hypothetical protein